MILASKSCTSEVSLVYFKQKALGRRAREKTSRNDGECQVAGRGKKEQCEQAQKRGGARASIGEAGPQ